MAAETHVADQLRLRVNMSTTKNCAVALFLTLLLSACASPAEMNARREADRMARENLLLESVKPICEKRAGPIRLNTESS